MTISELAFDNERELQNWVECNLHAFLPNALWIPGCQVTTVSGKLGVPDGFAFDFVSRQWYVIEHELLAHGVWPHIAEQVVRFVVALQNPSTRRKLRDHLFERLIADNLVGATSTQLRTTNERLLQQIELFIEGTSPQVLIFIDDTNQDLKDLAHALAVPTSIFRIQKFHVNGVSEYYSPDRHVPVIATDISEDTETADSEYDVVKQLGGGIVEQSVRRFKCYRLSDGSLVHIKRSKFHEDNNYFWYGIGQTAVDYCNEFGVTHVVFVMGGYGFVKVPMNIVADFIVTTGATRNADGTVRHYHCLISPGPNPELYWSNDVARFDLTEHYHQFD